MRVRVREGEEPRREDDAEDERGPRGGRSASMFY